MIVLRLLTLPTHKPGCDRKGYLDKVVSLHQAVLVALVVSAAAAAVVVVMVMVVSVVVEELAAMTPVLPPATVATVVAAQVGLFHPPTRSPQARAVPQR